MPLIDDFVDKFNFGTKAEVEPKFDKIDWSSYYGGTYPEDKEIILFLIAHLYHLDYVATNSGSGGNLVASKSYGSVSVSYQLPEYDLSNSFWQLTSYGKRYLMLIQANGGVVAV